MCMKMTRYAFFMFPILNKVKGKITQCMRKINNERVKYR